MTQSELVLDKFKQFLSDKHREYALGNNVVQAATTRYMKETLDAYEKAGRGISLTNNQTLTEPYSVRYQTGEGVSIIRYYTTLTEALHVANYVETFVHEYVVSQLLYRGEVIMTRGQFEKEYEKRDYFKDAYKVVCVV